MARTAARQAPREPARATEIRGRDGEVLTRRADNSGAGNQFHVPASMQEKGWSLQWVRAECIGKPDPANLNDHHENGWRPVPADRFPGTFHEADYKGAINREGLVLMERPQALTDMALEADRREASELRSSQVEDFAVSELPAGFDRGYGKAAKRVNRAIEVAPENSYPSRQLAVPGDDD